jgi:outer membrane protein OmpA-like peptidoglycan-associated protein
MKLNKLLLTILTSLIVLSQVSAQSTSLATKRANKLYNQFNFLDAAKMYLHLVNNDSTNIAAKQKLADCYRLMNRSDLSEVWYGQLANTSNTHTLDKFYYAQALMTNEKYEEAKKAYQQYLLTLDPAGKMANEITKEIAQIETLFKDNPAYTIQGLSINTPASDFGPSLYKNQLFFSSNRQEPLVVKRIDVWTNMPFLQIYIADIDSNNTCAKPVLFNKGKANGKFHAGPVSVDPVLNDMYITRSNYIRKPQKSLDETVKLKIYRLVFNPATNQWGKKIIDDFPYNSDQYSCAHPTISRDGQELYFASDMPGGMGGSDIYVCKKDVGIWGEPQNLKQINTPGEELFPFISADGTLYFSSNGYFGLGGLDIYQIKNAGENGGKPINLGAPINSSKDDFAYIENGPGSKGFFTSNRSGGIGDDDIYSFTKDGLKICGEVIDDATKAKLEMATVKLYDGTVLKMSMQTDENGAFCFEVEPNKKFVIVASKQDYTTNDLLVDVKTVTQNVQIPLKKSTGILLDVLIIDAKTKLPIGAADVQLINQKTNQEARKITDANGKTFYELDVETDYKIIASKDLGSNSIEQYFNNSTTFNTKGIKTPTNFDITIELRKEKPDIGIKIPDIYYDLDKYNIRPDAAKELDKIVKILKDNPTMEIELSSHTDCRSGARYNMWLSAKRAEAAVNYIIRQGITPYRMVAAGYGETRLLNDCVCEPDNNSPCSEEEHQMNRRTEFKILKF